MGRCVEEPCTVHVDGDAVPVGHLADGRHGRQVDAVAAGEVVAVFQTDKARAALGQQLVQLVGVGHVAAVLMVADRDKTAKVWLKGELLGEQHMLLLVHQNGLPRVAVGHDGDGVAEGAGGHQDSGLLADQCSGRILQTVDGGVLAPAFSVGSAVVAQLCRQNRLQHGAVGHRQGIAS